MVRYVAGKSGAESRQDEPLIGDQTSFTGEGLSASHFVLVSHAPIGMDEAPRDLDEPPTLSTAGLWVHPQYHRIPPPPQIGGSLFGVPLNQHEQGIPGNPTPRLPADLGCALVAGPGTERAKKADLAGGAFHTHRSAGHTEGRLPLLPNHPRVWDTFYICILSICIYTCGQAYIYIYTCVCTSTIGSLHKGCIP